MVRPVCQALLLPVVQNIVAIEFYSSFFYERCKLFFQMFTEFFVHLISGDILNLDQIPGQIT